MSRDGSGGFRPGPGGAQAPPSFAPGPPVLWPPITFGKDSTTVIYLRFQILEKWANLRLSLNV